MARVVIKRRKERVLRHAIWEKRDAIDRYTKAADRGAFQIKVGSAGYPPDLKQSSVQKPEYHCTSARASLISYAVHLFGQPRINCAWKNPAINSICLVCH
jgi:hypothetical protein